MSSEVLLQSYKWIIKNLFETILSRETQLPVSIVQFTVQPAIEVGENYSSQLIRVQIDYKLNEKKSDSIRKSLIIKASLGEKLVRSRDVFAKEIEVFTKIIPAIERTFRNYGLIIHLAPKCYDSNSIDSYIILADLIADSYINVHRQIGLNKDQLKSCLKLLSRWHAGTSKLIHEGWTPQEQYVLFQRPHVSVTGSKHYRNLFQNALSSCVDAFQNDPDLHLICDKLNDLQTSIFQRCCDAVQCDEDEFNVLTHGDLWSNNIMFNASDDNDRLLFLDFQMCYWGSPILDVVYLLFTSSSGAINAQDWDALIEYYFGELVSTMQLLECNALCPSNEQFHRQFRARAIHGVAFSLFSVPMRLMDQPPSNAIMKFLDVSDEGEEFRHEIYSQKKVRKLLKKLLLYFDKKSLLD